MRNPFAKPRTPGQWLVGSGCWIISCTTVFLVVLLLFDTYDRNGDLSSLLLLLLTIAMHLIIWQKVIFSTWVAKDDVVDQWLGTAATLLKLVLTVFQLVFLVVLMVLTIMALIVLANKAVGTTVEI